jgi:hypothetical protein
MTRKERTTFTAEQNLEYAKLNLFSVPFYMAEMITFNINRI